MLEVKWKVGYSSTIIISTISFNPCYVGSKMESLIKSRMHVLNFFVSILVMLEVKWKVKPIHRHFLYSVVSILVMLEVKWKDINRTFWRSGTGVSILVMLEVKWKA